MLGIYIRTSREGGKDESPIEQQKREGIKFAEKHNYQFEVYEDKGISGFKISSDEQDPFKNHPRFTDLVADIKLQKIDMVWVWEHSRLSRNQYASAIIFNLFEKNNIKVFERDKEFNLKDPHSKMFRGILDIMAEHERSLIVGRITRSLHNRIEKGKRSFGKLYGYKKVGVDSKGYQILDKVDSEIENIKYGYKRILEGATLRQLTLELYNKKSEQLRFSRYWYNILRHFVYTGYALNMEGLELLRQFDKFEIENLSLLKDGKYYTKSASYPHELISIEKWIQAVEKLHFNQQKKNKYKTRKASKDLVTGILKCSECGQKYYSHIHEHKQYYYVY